MNALILGAFGASPEAKFVSLESKITTGGTQPGTRIHTLTSNHGTNTTQVGTQFEEFCKLYLKFKGYDCWDLKECPGEHLTRLNLERRDIGIDLIAHRDDQWFAVQCKYRSPTRDKLGRTRHCVGWKELSTFLSIAARTGGQNGWTKHIVMTNAKNVSWQGRKNDKDMTIARAALVGDFERLQGWCTTNETPTNTLIVPSNPSSPSTPNDDLRSLRCKWLDKLTLS
jgi:hypothetical protein